MPSLLARTATASAVPLETAITNALARIPPLWPLRHFVAVNPFVGLANRSFESACALLQRTHGSAPLLAPADYLKAFRDGEISRSDLTEATQEPWTVASLLAAVEKVDDPRACTPIPTVADLLDRRDARPHWARFVVEEIAKWCSVHFDQNQTAWRSPWRTKGLYAAWKEAASLDRNPEAFGLPQFRRFVDLLPRDADDAILEIVLPLAPPDLDLTDFLHRQLVTVSGWAGYAQYLDREHTMRGETRSVLRELLAVRLAYDGALLHAFDRDGTVRDAWRSQFVFTGNADRLAPLVQWQNAYERSYQRRLATALARPPSRSASARPAFQAIFCIDVRSEVFRRHLEAVAPTAQTLGFAGFFGFAVSHRTAGAADRTARCPVLLVPPLASTDGAGPDDEAHANASRAAASAWFAFQNAAASSFSFVETAGLGFAALLARARSGRQTWARPSCRRAPRFELDNDAPLEALADTAASALRGMSLTQRFARLVLICGHGSESANNPHASSLDCGACGGHAGDVNARLAATVFNDPRIRARLAERGLAIPADTVFIAARHTTVTDEVELFDLDQIPASHREELPALRAALAQAGARTRAERAKRLGLTVSDNELHTALRVRATDIAEVRPEWGLANNAAFIAAPRSRTSALNLEGRAFLHEYTAASDLDGKILAAILGGPGVVASWINLQYYASRVDPAHFGAGNKVLHNVVGGLGAMEGNGGDLKVGLPLQSLHDGERFLHEPRRLNVFVEASRARVDTALAAASQVRQLAEHQWIHLFAIEDDRIYRWTPEDWTDFALPGPAEWVQSTEMACVGAPD